VASLEVRELTRRYSDTVTVGPVSFVAREREFLSLLGPSGCGKTTSLRCIAGFETPTSGDILIDGRSILNEPPHRRDVGLVFQNYALFPHLSVFENVAFGLRLRRRPRGEIEQRVEDALRLVDLGGLGTRYPRQLSGGQQQRVALARCLALEPRMLLLDEPLSNLDLKLRLAMRNEIRALQRRLGKTTVYVTHDQGEALALSDCIVVMSRGRVEQIGSPREIYERPRTPFVAEFIGASNLLPCVVEARGPDGTRLRVNDVTLVSRDPGPAGSTDGGLVALIRPERIRLDPDGRAPAGSDNRFAAAVAAVTYLGEDLQLAVTVDGGPVLTVSKKAGGSEGEPGIGDRVVVTITPEDVRILAVPSGSATS
jgi:spermidine/putrescine ABC transporter ATP-binding subunit